jgi:TolA-binding protein
MRASSIAVLTIVGIIMLACPLGPAQAQVDSREGIALQNQIYQLRQEVQSLRDQIARGGGGSMIGGGNTARPYPPTTGGGDMVAQLLTRVDGLEDQLRQLHGRIDELQNQMQRQNAEFGKRLDDLAYQMNSRPGGLTAPGPTAGPAPGPGQLQSPPPEGPPPPRVRTPENAMQEGNAALARRDYAAAEAAAREVIAARNSPRVYDGQMLLAQALFGERKYAEAAVAFDDTYKRNRKGAHAPDALVGRANAFVGIGEKQLACATLEQLQAEFPQTRADLRQSIAAASQRAGCH